ncbi:hypothetical protein [Rhizobium nepotum]|uniref:hypothetical protein n=1 Tax=Rhizobium nepotum TaxID=1035271 RepID=UPI003CEFF6E8
MKAKNFSELADLLTGYTTEPAKQKPTKIPKAANDNKPASDVLAWPALERLAYRGDLTRVQGLQRWRDFRHPKDMVIVDEEDQYEPELTIETRPSEAGLLAAVGRKVVDRERWEHTGEMVNVYDDSPEPKTEYTVKAVGGPAAIRPSLEARIGSLTFADGALKFWGVTAKGRKLQPDERRRGEKGGAISSGRSESEIWSYIRLKGAVSPLASEHLHRPFFGEQREACAPTPEAEEARRVLQEFGVDGSVPFEKLRHAATRGPDAIVTGPQWVGGVKKPKPTASRPAGRDHNAGQSIEADNFIDYLVEKLGQHAKVLDLAITDMNARNIGVAMGLAPSYAEKRGPILIEAAIDALNAELRRSDINDHKFAA